MKNFFKSKLLLHLFLVLFSAGIVFSSTGCRGSKGQRRAYKMQKQSLKEGSKQQEDLVKAHYDIQSDNTKQMMKEMEKENKKLKKNKKRSLWDRLFRKRCR